MRTQSLWWGRVQRTQGSNPHWAWHSLCPLSQARIHPVARSSSKQAPYQAPLVSGVAALGTGTTPTPTPTNVGSTIIAHTLSRTEIRVGIQFGLAKGLLRNYQGHLDRNWEQKRGGRTGKGVLFRGPRQPCPWCRCTALRGWTGDLVTVLTASRVPLREGGVHQALKQLQGAA